MPPNRRSRLLRDLADAGRSLSDAAVMYHSTLAERLGLGTSEWKTLGLLERFGPMTAGDLAERSGLAPPSVTGILDRLERDGWIMRERDPADRRRVIVRLDAALSAARFAGSFEGLRRRLNELYALYDEDQLALVCEVLQAMAERQHAATAELAMTAPTK